MKNYDIGEYKNIDAFVEAKLKYFEGLEKNFKNFFELVFREKSNIMYERSAGYRIVKTTYKEAYEDILKKAVTLKKLLSDIEKNSIIGLCMDNSLEWLEIFWALLAAGYRPLLINLRLSDGVLEKAFADTGVKAIVSDRRKFDTLMIMADDIIPAEDVTEDGDFGTEILVMSSGTSENLKICAYSAEEFYYQICDSCDIIRKSKEMKSFYDGYIKQLTLLPFYHIFGLSAVYIWFAFFSRTFVELNDMAPQTIQNTVKRHKVTHIFAVPLFWEKVYEQAIKTIKARGDKTYEKFCRGLKISRKIGGVPIIGKLFAKVAFKEVRENMFGESLQFLITGGSVIRPEVLEFFNSIGYHLANGFGMTEIGITSVELSGNPKKRSMGYIGQPLSSVRYEVKDGELIVSGKTTAKYTIESGIRRNREDKFSTHDLVEYSNGNYKIYGRRDEIIIASDGENINPNLIEPNFKIKGVNGICLIAAKSGETTIPVMLVSIKKYISKEKFKEIDADVRKAVEGFNLTAQIRKIEYISDSLLSDEEFKLNRKRLARDYNDGKLSLVTVIDNNAVNDELAKKVRAFFAVALDKDENDIGIDENFFSDDGGTSLDYCTLVVQLENEFGIEFPKRTESALSTVSEVCSFLRNKNVC